MSYRTQCTNLQSVLSSTNHTMAHLADGAVGLQEVGLQEGVEQVARDALDRVVDGQHVHALPVLHIRALHSSK